eukprot:3820388-Alexandrium_andersonii.AAC.1
MLTAKHSPAAKAPPLYYTNKAPATPNLKQDRKTVNALHLEPMASPVQPPAASLPGKLASKTPRAPEVGNQQRGEPSFKGEDCNTQPNVDKEFSHRYFDVGPKDFVHTLDF